MPVETKVIRGKLRTVKSETGHIAKTKHGKPVDGGGWPTNKHGSGMARRQVNHINEANDKVEFSEGSEAE